MKAMQRTRRGVSTAQVCILLAVISLVVVSAVKSLGTNAKTSLTTTAGNVANPSTLPSRFGS